ncbi:uncharacterized protein LOC131159506 isoform X2 [Malania oleifera]|uniref:uncharacterized protein LOC131159506 isoform X2 n=1 Tax=Malania oleifera TaxID=397392 RepID=UPI0025AEB916|nr:uncharacterized protein LOC131159506 isoform X2 [Malania oleifera]
MDQDRHNPSHITSFHDNKMPNADIVDLGKKRKLQAELLGLPIPKHKSRDRSYGSLLVSLLDEIPEVDTCIIEGKSDTASLDDSDLQSARDSNSFAEDSDSSMCASGGSKLESDCVKTWTCSQPSTSVNWGSRSFLNGSSLDRLAGMEKEGVREELILLCGKHNHPQNDVKLPVSHDLEELLDFGIHDPKYMNYGIDQCTDKELNSLPYSHEESRSSTRKPTIDQEFEEYFSTLMLQ